MLNMIRIPITASLYMGPVPCAALAGPAERLCGQEHRKDGSLSAPGKKMTVRRFVQLCLSLMTLASGVLTVVVAADDGDWAVRLDTKHLAGPEASAPPDIAARCPFLPGHGRQGRRDRS